MVVAWRCARERQSKAARELPGRTPRQIGRGDEKVMVESRRTGAPCLRKGRMAVFRLLRQQA